MEYLNEHPDPRFPDRVGDALKGLYRAVEPTLAEHTDALFGAMVQEVANPEGPATARYWAAAAIVGYAFELRDSSRPASPARAPASASRDSRASQSHAGLPAAA